MSRAIVIVLALFLDIILGEPPNRWHPVALMGRWLIWGQQLAPRRYRFWFGAGWTLVGMMLFAWPWRVIPMKIGSPKCILGLLPRLLLAIRLLGLAALLKPLFAYRNLRRAAAAVGQALAGQDIVEARRLVGWHLVSRDTTELSPAEAAGAAIESLAENMTDSLAAPLWAYALGGLPAAWVYRFVNTADAMWGYRTVEFEQLGKFPARLDDALNWLPARLSGWLFVVAAWLAGEDASGAAHTMLNQHQGTPSPNAGWTMSAMAGALHVTLSKRDTYDLAGGSDALDTPMIRRALRLADICVALNIALICLFLYLLKR